MGKYSLDLIYLQSPAIQVKHQDSDLPTMVIGIKSIMGIYSLDLIYLQSPAIQVELQGADLPLYGYSVFMIWLHNKKFVFLPVRQSKPAIMDPISVQCYSVRAVKVKFNSDLRGQGFLAMGTGGNGTTQFKVTIIPISREK
ncbi:hypothetical protein PHYBLDRAFT_174449 [Phycomyces blakesleeanus NRRL 1555(-)]|uniref:Uncharacterized protein n=1 Tax=Phycomyces blakesleeanus (strain ATCC 8743b / DSM 1359 / FGSC 10004 / NBRC 33097 / NRRL 1555) TaxID=763407 RepID=A0A162ZKF1_PHYB8|nr:hypothetical protein PHYBLDRAFT_174449 [Phycomyces blakesleeanus NRRL 1555(-)]OAD67411.1 hypothetical protein PHYBLDRAFT_174449 [Phycomyces blakesleeanus NRRL 1555(-)]|eukprot:XP_018285451.1 hypothetical protein PHYBLDRAFT_174449 [Phycomyces blakesleeanus NRRL 1555(-)]